MSISEKKNNNMHPYGSIYRTVLFIFLILFSLLPTNTWALFYIEFHKDGKINYYNKNPKKKPKKKPLVCDQFTIGANPTTLYKLHKEKITLDFLDNKSTYILKSPSDLLNDEEIEFKIFPGVCVIFNCGEQACKSLNIKGKKNSTGGKFINKSILTLKKEEKCLFVINDVTFANQGKLIFPQPTFISLENGYFINDGTVLFKKHARILGPSGYIKYPFLYSKETKPHLINNKLIKGEQDIGLFLSSYISETGRICAPKGVVNDWKGSTTFRCTDIPDLSKSIPLLAIAEKFPVIDIIRIPEEINQKDLSLGALGEETAIYFYKNIHKKKAISCKSNNKDNGIDVIGYSPNQPTTLIPHESKNESSNGFALKNNQMTKQWIYSHLFQIYQRFLKDHVACTIHSGRSFMSESLSADLEVMFLHIVADEEFLKDIIFYKNKEKTLPKIEIRKHKTFKELKRIINIGEDEISEDAMSYFKELTIFARGNSVYHCPLPCINQIGFESDTFKTPTYFLRRDLTTRYEQE